MSTSPNLSVREIYAELMAGKIITLQFSTQEDIKNFQSHIRSVRSKMEGAVKNIGFEEDNAKDVLRFNCDPPIKIGEAPADIYKLSIWLEPKKYPYTIISVSDA